jgi:hypothetical protein
MGAGFCKRSGPQGKIAYLRSRERQARGVEQAETLLKEGTRAGRLDKESLAALPANDAWKVELARSVRKKTTASKGWIAQRLGMRFTGSRRDSKNCLLSGQFIKMQSDAH